MLFDGIYSESFSISLGDDLFFRGEVHAPKDRANKPVILVCHGFKGHKDWNFFPRTADELASNGYYAIRFNFSCNGVKDVDFDELDKFAVNTYSRELDDLAVLMEYMKEQKLPFSEQFDLERVGMIGHSRGGATSVIFAAENPEVKGIACWNGVSDVDFLNEDLKEDICKNGTGYIANKRTNQDMPLKSNILEDIKNNKDRFNILTTLKTMDAPVLIVQGDADSEWLRKGAEKMNQAAPHHSLVIIEGGTHTFNASHPLNEVPIQLNQAQDETINFFHNILW
ncbi:alpha/beta hydrolase family protein [Salibacterium salarium]|uniref:alpha/beta hydrolase family protein n=1 Tax=Salibacterium salarium TaxID=284579 RepID=UPI00163B2216|nr:alpha/beta fold hydrolase [Salibacterium salarium]